MAFVGTAIYASMLAGDLRVVRERLKKAEEKLANLVILDEEVEVEVKPASGVTNSYVQPVINQPTTVVKTVGSYVPPVINQSTVTFGREAAG